MRKSVCMESVKIRDLRGATLRDKAREGKPLAITDHRELIGVIIPVVPEWVEHVIDRNWSEVQQSIAEGEESMTADTPLRRLEDVAADQLTVPLVAALAGTTITQPARTRETLHRLRAVLNPTGPATGSDPAEPSSQTVRIGDVSAALIRKAGDNGQTLAITHDHELVGIIIPVTRHLIEYLIEQNVSRVLYSISLGEKEIGGPDPLVTLDDVAGAE
jgi:antitoxin (DNA-binding transcriptional repressor) of toxin-antitoxin stability system